MDIMAKKELACLVTNCGRIDRLGGAILGVSAEISQISDAPGLDGVVNIFLYLVEKGK